MLLILGGIVMAATVSVLIIRAAKRKNRAQQAEPPTGFTVRVSLLVNSQTFYAPTLIADNRLLVPLLANEQVFYGPTVSREEALVLPLLTNSQAFYAPSINQTLTVPLLTNEQSFYGPQVAADDRLTLPLLTNTQTFYAPSINQHVLLPLLTNSQTFYGATVLRDTALDVPLLTNTQTFYQAAIRQNINLPRVNSSNGFFPITVSQPSVPGFQLSTPSVTVISAAGDPPEVTLGINSDHYAGYYLDIERSTASAKNASDGSYVTPTMTISHLITADEVAELEITNADLAPDGYFNPPGTYYQSYRIRREDGALSQRVEITGTVVGSVAEWSTVGFNKSQYLTLDDLSAVMNNSPGNASNVRATIEGQGDSFSFKVTIDSLNGTGGIICGIVDRDTNLGSGGDLPGLNCPGISVKLDAGGSIFYRNGGQTSAGLGAAAVGDEVVVTVTKSTQTARFQKYRGGVMVAQTAITAMSSQQPSRHYAFAGGYRLNDGFTGDFTNYG